MKATNRWAKRVVVVCLLLGAETLVGCKRATNENSEPPSVQPGASSGGTEKTGTSEQPVGKELNSHGTDGKLPSSDRGMSALKMVEFHDLSKEYEFEKAQYDASAGRFVWKMRSRKPEPTDDFDKTVWKAIVLDAQIQHVRYEVGDGVQLQLWSNGTRLAKMGTRLKRPGDQKDILDRVIVEAEIPVELYKRIDEATYNARP